jgi:TrmH RNA methyltransferase
VRRGPPPPHKPQRHAQSPQGHRDERRPAPGAERGELTIGLRAGLAIFARRRDEILRVGYSRAVKSEVDDLVRWAEGARVRCEELPEGELARIAQSEPHEGLCVLARERRWASAGELADLLARTRGTAIALDRVRNPYNIGAIVRSAAFFGVDAVLLGTPAPHPGLPPTALRVAEGGAEHVLLSRTTDLADTLSRLRAKKVQVVGADGASDKSALGFAFGRPAMLVLGNEREGMGERVRAQCDAIVAIRGSDAVESLNVAVAAGVMIAEMARKG